MLTHHPHPHPHPHPHLHRAVACHSALPGLGVTVGTRLQPQWPPVSLAPIRSGWAKNGEWPFLLFFGAMPVEIANPPETQAALTGFRTQGIPMSPQRRPYGTKGRDTGKGIFVPGILVDFSASQPESGSPRQRGSGLKHPGVLVARFVPSTDGAHRNGRRTWATHMQERYQAH